MLSDVTFVNEIEMQKPVEEQTSTASDYRRYTLSMLGLLLAFNFAVGAVILAVTTLNVMSDRDGFWKRFGSSRFHLQDQLARLSGGSYSLSFGTSRSNQLSEELVGRPLLNMSYVYGNPSVVADLLDRLTDEQWRNVDKLYFLVDLHTLDAARHVREIEELLDDNSLAGAWWSALTSYGFDALVGSIRSVVWNLVGGHRYYIAEDGNVVDVSNRRYNGILSIQACWIDAKKRKLDAAASLARIATISKRHGVDTVFYTGIFTPGYAISEYEFIRRHAEVVLQHIGEFHMFYFVPEISTDFSLFVDESHLTPKGFKRLFRLDWRDYLVDQSTVSARLNVIQSGLSFVDSSSERRACSKQLTR